MATRTTEIPAIFVTEAESLLDKLGAGDAYRSGELRCDACEEPLNGQGIGAVMLRDGIVRASCARSRCVEDLSG